MNRKDSGNHRGPLPADILKEFNILKQQLVSNSLVAYPIADRQYTLIVDTSTGSATEERGLGAILTQINSDEFRAWTSLPGGEERGELFILYTDYKPLENLGYLHKKTLNRLQIAMNEFVFKIR